MKRRAFLSLSALSAVPLVAQEANDGPEPNWHETVLVDMAPDITHLLQAAVSS